MGSCVIDGTVATSAGVLPYLKWDHLVSADKDLDGDGRADLVALEPTLGDDPGWHKLSLIADRPRGPAEIPVKGAEPGDWDWVDLATSPDRMLTVHKRGSGFEKQVFTWDGHAFVSKDIVLLRWSSNVTPHVPGTNWFLDAIAAGKTANFEFDQVARKTELSPSGGLLDLRGDGDRYFMLELKSYPPPGIDSPVETTQFIMELRKDGWARVSAPFLFLQTRADRDKDGLPEYVSGLREVDLVACTAKAPDCDTAPYSPTALAGWDGQSLSAYAPNLKSLYASRLKDALDEVASFAGASPPTSCPSDRLDTVSKLYLARRWSGVDDAAAASEVSTAMKGTSFTPCAGEGGRARAWPAIWKNLRSSLQSACPSSP